MSFDYEIIRSRRKTIAIQIRPDCRIVVRAPLRLAKRDIIKFVVDKRDWVEKHLTEMKRRLKEQPETKTLSREEIEELAGKALRYIPPRVREYAEKIGVSYGRVTIRNQKTRWGSCSSKGNLNFNCQLMRLPEELVDYVIIHELCHRKEMNHSADFWAEVEKYCPDHKALRKRLKGEMIYE